MKCQQFPEVQTDAGFRKEEKDGVDTGRSQRGATFMRIGAGTTASGQGRPCHILDWHCSSLKVVTRSTFASETQAAIAATDSALMLALTMHQIRAGPVTPRQGMTLLQDGGLNIKINMGVDAMILVSALRNARLRTPSERTMLSKNNC